MTMIQIGSSATVVNLNPLDRIERTFVSTALLWLRIAVGTFQSLLNLFPQPDHFMTILRFDKAAVPNR